MLHPEGKQGQSIEKTKYETIGEAVLACLDSCELTHAQLNARVQQKSVLCSKVQSLGTLTR
jgi:hypothetical protein